MLDMNSNKTYDDNWEDTDSDANSDVDTEHSICPEPSYIDRIELALQTWKQGQHENPKMSAQYAAKVYQIAKSTLTD